VPGLGWSIDNLDYPFMSRKWEFDEALLNHSINSFKEDKIKYLIINNIKIEYFDIDIDYYYLFIAVIN
jgi:hypothetical protein